MVKPAGWYPSIGQLAAARAAAIRKPRLRELAASRVRWGYRRLTVLLRREGWKVNPKRIYRLYSEEGLTVTRPIQWPRLFPPQPFSRGAIMSQVRPSEAAIFNTENRFVPTMLTLDMA